MAPTPKKDSETIGNDNLRTLCILMASATEFNPDYNVVAQECGISHAKNVPRKIDSILKPMGYVLKNKKVVKLDNGEGNDTNIPASTATPATPKTPRATTKTSTAKKPAAAAKKVKDEPKTPGASDIDMDGGSSDEADSPVEEKPAKSATKGKKSGGATPKSPAVAKKASVKKTPAKKAGAAAAATGGSPTKKRKLSEPVDEADEGEDDAKEEAAGDAEKVMIDETEDDEAMKMIKEKMDGSDVEQGSDDSN